MLRGRGCERLERVGDLPPPMGDGYRVVLRRDGFVAACLLEFEGGPVISIASSSAGLQSSLAS